MLAVDKDNFEQEVVQSDIPCVVDVWGPQCAPCLALLPSVEKLAEEYDGKIKFCKLDSSANRRLCITLKVLGLPTIMFYKGGERVATLSKDEVSLESIKAEAEKLVA